ncbi:MAG: hypothetical protein J0L58_20900, partial [Burkholderiales bacterium]|nr:hypothetical protein [Burkholderiales bacterium]
MKRRALGLLLLPLLGWAQTERKGSRPIYRCGNTLSDRPCSADATASSVRFDDPSRADAQAARQAFASLNGVVSEHLGSALHWLGCLPAGYQRPNFVV